MLGQCFLCLRSLSLEYCCCLWMCHCQWGVHRVPCHPFRLFISTHQPHTVAPELVETVYMLHTHCIYLICTADMQCRTTYLLEVIEQALSAVFGMVRMCKWCACLKTSCTHLDRVYSSIYIFFRL